MTFSEPKALASTSSVTDTTTDYETTGSPTTSTVQASTGLEAFPTEIDLTTTQLSSALEPTIIITESATTAAIAELTTATDVIGEDATTTAPVTDTTATLEFHTTTTAELVTTTSEEASTVFTTTSEDPATPTFIVNSGFDDSSSSYDPWTFWTSNRELGIDIKVNIDSTTKHEGLNSVHFEYIRSGVSYLRQPLTIIPKAGTMYHMSAWTRTTGQTISRCNSARIRCTFGDGQIATQASMSSLFTSPDTWLQISSSCSYTQAQIDIGNLYLYVGLVCLENSQGWIDTVKFGDV